MFALWPEYCEIISRAPLWRCIIVGFSFPVVAELRLPPANIYCPFRAKPLTDLTGLEGRTDISRG